MLVWVPLVPVARALDGIDGITVAVVDPDDGSELPPSASEVELYVPPLIPRAAALATAITRPCQCIRLKQPRHHPIASEVVMLVWVPLVPVARALDGIDGITVAVVDPDDGSELPPSASEVELSVRPPFPRAAALAAMAAMPSLRVVQTLTAGVDLVRPHIPVGAMLCNARGVHDPSTAEWVVTATLAAIRQIPYFTAEQAAGRWSNRFTGSLAGQSVLIVGYGSIGHAVERRLAGFDAQIVRGARGARDGGRSLPGAPALLPQADVVILLAPVTGETIGMVDSVFLAAMKDGALLVNGARGTLVVTDDLCAELSTGRLRAALDVTDPEPLPAGHPLWAMPNALITPHVAASTAFSATAALAFLREQVLRWRGDTPLVNVITGEY